MSAPTPRLCDSNRFHPSAPRCPREAALKSSPALVAQQPINAFWRWCGEHKHDDDVRATAEELRP